MLRLKISTNTNNESGEYIYNVSEQEIEAMLFVGKGSYLRYDEIPRPRDVNGNLPPMPYKSLKAQSGSIRISKMPRVERIYSGLRAVIETRNIVLSDGATLDDISITLKCEHAPA